jgi:hypothetical protein
MQEQEKLRSSLKINDVFAAILAITGTSLAYIEQELLFQ